jgi:hypothetical protein
MQNAECKMQNAECRMRKSPGVGGRNRVAPTVWMEDAYGTAVPNVRWWQGSIVSCHTFLAFGMLYC